MSTTQATQLKSFNQTISIEVSIDSIAQKMASMMNPEDPHTNLLVNVVVGQAVANSRTLDLGRIFNAMNGHVDRLDFEVGQELFCEEDVHSYLFSKGGSRHKIGPCKILTVDPLKDGDTIKVEYTTMNYNGKVVQDQRWVSPRDLRALSGSEPEQLERAIEIALEDRKPKDAVSNAEL